MSTPTQHGYILTRQWRDTRDGSEVELWVAMEGGARRVVLTGQRSVAFVAASARDAVESVIRRDAAVELTPLPLKTFGQEPVLGVYTRGHRVMQALEKQLAERGVVLHEADIRPDDRYLMERFITASVTVEATDPDAATLVDPRLRPGERYRPSLRMVSLDIETRADGQLYSVALEGCGQRQVYMLGVPGAGGDAEDDFDLTYVEDHAALIVALNNWFRHHDPDVIIGWNLIQFDLRLLQACADRCGRVLTLGRGGTPIDWREHRHRDNYVFASIPGRLPIDGIEALRSASWNFASFSLEAVARELLGEGKDIDDPYSRMDEIERRFHHDKPALARYNLHDCELVTRIFQKTGVLAFLLERADVTGLQADRSGGSIAAFTYLYLPRMHRAGYVAPRTGRATGESYPGGFVMESRPGIYDSILVLDYKSLYPSIIRTFLVDPIGLVEGMRASDDEAWIPGPLDTRFSRTQHCLPALIAQLWTGRDAAKAQGNTPLAQAFKLLMNAFTGVLGAPDARFFDPRLISAITLRGHQIMQQTQAWIEAQGYETIYGDTDSIFIRLGRPHDEPAAQAVADDLVSYINAAWATRLRSEMAIDSYLEIEFDTHYARFFMPTIRGSETGSKKRYAGLVREGDSEQLVFRGLEAVRSDWTPLARQFQEELFGRIFRRQPHEDYIRACVRDLRAGRLDDRLVYRKRLRGRLDSYDRVTPPQVRAARLADDHNARVGRPLQYQGGGWIRYVMTLAGPEPLEVRRSVIDHEHYVEHQLRPIADAILPLVGGRFDRLVSGQSQLF